MNKRNLIESRKQQGYRVLFNGIFMKCTYNGKDFIEEFKRKHSNHDLLDELLHRSDHELDKLVIEPIRHAMIIHNYKNYYPFSLAVHFIQVDSTIISDEFTNSITEDRRLLEEMKQHEHTKHLTNIDDIKQVLKLQIECAYELNTSENLIRVADVYPRFIFEKNKNALDKNKHYKKLMQLG